MTTLSFHLNFGVFPLDHCRCWGQPEQKTLGEIIFEVFQPVWTTYLNVTDRQTDGQRDGRTIIPRSAWYRPVRSQYWRRYSRYSSLFFDSWCTACQYIIVILIHGTFKPKIYNLQRQWRFSVGAEGWPRFWFCTLSLAWCIKKLPQSISLHCVDRNAWDWELEIYLHCNWWCVMK